MADLLTLLSDRLAPAFVAVGRAGGLSADEAAAFDPVVRPSDRADAQANGALALAKQLGRNPRDVAERRARRRRPRRRWRAAEIAGPGFINLTVDDALPRRHARRRRRRRASRRRRRQRAATGSSSTTRRRTWPRRCTSATCAPPSSATRSCGCSTFVGHDVVRENHIGDWGTPVRHADRAPRRRRSARIAARLALADLDELLQGRAVHVRAAIPTSQARAAGPRRAAAAAATPRPSRCGTCSSTPAPDT